VALGITRILTPFYLIFAFIILGFYFYYFLTHPIHLAKIARIKTSSEMVLSVLYMVISMKSASNLENAVKFTASSLSGPLGDDLKRLLWSVETGKYRNITDALMDYRKKWSRENAEFVRSIEMIVESLYQDYKTRDRLLDEALDVVLSGSADRMDNYARGLSLPVMVLNALGITLPVLGMIIFPLVSIFIGEAFSSANLAVGYNIILPLFVWWIMNNVMENRPLTFSQVDLSEHPDVDKIGKFKISSYWIPVLPVAFLAGVIILSFGLLFWLPKAGEHTVLILFLSSLVVASASIGVAIYFLLGTYPFVKIQNEIEVIEDEFKEVLFQLGHRISGGIPLELALSQTYDSIRDYKISGLVKRCMDNIKLFGMTFEQSLFDKEVGALRFYPSKKIKSIMRIIADSYKKGSSYASLAMLTISKYLKSVHKTQENINEVLSESVSSLQFQGYVLIPVVSGIVVALTQIIFSILLILAQKVQALAPVEGGVPIFNPVETIVNFKSVTPPEILQLIVGFYMMEVSIIVGWFFVGILKGENTLLKKYTTGQILIIATVIYITVMIGVSFAFGSLIDLITGIGGTIT